MPLGIVSDWLVRRGAPPWRARKRLLQTVAVFGPLAAVIPLTASPGTALALFAIVTASSLAWLTLSTVLAAQLFARTQVGTAVGILSAIGTVGAALFNFAVGPAIEAWGYAVVLIACGMLQPLGALALIRLRVPER